MLGRQCPQAQISENKIILSLPDAMTPVVWVMDMSDTNQFVMKIDQNENGLFILQKISNDGKKIEDIAYYSDRKKAIRGMTIVTKTMNGAPKSCSKFKCLMCCAYKAIVLAASIGILLFIASLYSVSLNNLLLGGGSSAQPQQAQVQQQQQIIPQQPSAPVIETNPNAVGVPMSADDFLNQQGNSTFPF